MKHLRRNLDTLRVGQPELAELLGGLRREARENLEELRRVRDATGGYRPTRPNRPAFVSRTI